MTEEHQTMKTCRNVSDTATEKCTEDVQMTQEGPIIQLLMGEIGKAFVGLSELIPKR